MVTQFSSIEEETNYKNFKHDLEKYTGENLNIRINTWEKLLYLIINNYRINFLEIYKFNFINIIKSIRDPNILFKQVNFLYTMEISALYIGALYYKKEYKIIYDFISKIDLSGKKREYDFCISRIIRYYYLSSMHLNLIDINEFYILKVSNTEYNNENVLLVLNNIILEYFINNKSEYLPIILSKPLNYSNISLNNIELVFNYFYHGYGYLILGNYKKALYYFNEAEIYNKNNLMRLNIIKCVIVTKLLLGELNINYKWKNYKLAPYYKLIDIVKNGQIHELENLLITYKIEFTKNTKLYFIIKRLISNALREGIKKISNVYTKIYLDDINKIFSKNITYLIHKCILNKEINSTIQNNILVKNYKNTNLIKNNINDEIKKIIIIRENIKKQLHYSEVPKLTYDRVMKDEADLNDQFGI